jgi:hypothetical protein
MDCAGSTGVLSGSVPVCGAGPRTSFPLAVCGCIVLRAGCLCLLEDGSAATVPTSPAEVTSPSLGRRSMWLWDYVGFGVVTLGEGGWSGVGGFLCTLAVSSSSRRRVT